VVEFFKTLFEGFAKSFLDIQHLLCFYAIGYLLKLSLFIPLCHLYPSPGECAYHLLYHPKMEFIKRVQGRLGWATREIGDE